MTLQKLWQRLTVHQPRISDQDVHCLTCDREDAPQTEMEDMLRREQETARRVDALEELAGILQKENRGRDHG